MPAFAPLYARGKSNTKTIGTYTIGASSTDIIVDSVTGLSVGQHCFVGQSDFTVAEYVGKITAIDTLTVTVRFVGQVARSAGAKLWTPTASWQAATVPSAQIEPGFTRGIETLITSSQPLHTQTAERLNTMEITWMTASRTDRTAWNAWMVANAGDGKKSFTCAFADRDTGLVSCAKVKEMNPGAEQRAQFIAWSYRTWSSELLIVARETYL